MPNDSSLRTDRKGGKYPKRYYKVPISPPDIKRLYHTKRKTKHGTNVDKNNSSQDRQ